MLTVYLAMTLVGLALTVAHIRRRSARVWIAVLGTLLAGFAILSGFSIGHYVALAAGLVLLAAAVPVRRRGPVA